MPVCGSVCGGAGLYLCLCVYIYADSSILGDMLLLALRCVLSFSSQPCYRDSHLLAVFCYGAAGYGVSFLFHQGDELVVGEGFCLVLSADDVAEGVLYGLGGDDAGFPGVVCLAEEAAYAYRAPACLYVF